MRNEINRFIYKFGLICFLAIFLSVSGFATHSTSVGVKPEYVGGGSSNTFTFTITNNGPDPIYKVVISSDDFTIDSDPSCPSGWTPSHTDSSVTCITDAFGDDVLSSGNTAQISFSATSPEPSSDTEYTWTVKTRDNAQGYEYTNTDATTIVDVTPPTTTDNAPSGWQTTKPITVTLTCTDDASGCAKAYYCVDQSNSCSPTTEGSSVSVNQEGTNYVRYYSVDNVGNKENVKYATVQIDTVAPNTSDDYAFSGQWVNSNQTITLTPSDPVPGSGIKWTKYCTDGDNTCDPANGTDYTGPVTISDEGTTYFRYASQDNAGNTQLTVSKEVKIDKTDPSTSLSADPGSPDGENGWYVTRPTITLTCDDGAGDVSGCNKTYYHWNNGFSEYSGPILAPDGDHTLHYYSTDNAGNDEDEKTRQFKVDVVSPNAEIEINGDADYTNSPNVTLNLTYSDPGTSGVYECRYKNNGEDWTPWGNCTQTRDWTLPSEDGEKTVYYQVKDNAGNIGEDSDSILLDTVAPETEKEYGTPFYNDGTKDWITSSTNITLSASDADPSSGISSTEYKIDDESWITYAGSFTISGECEHTIEYKSTDNAGNIEETKSQTVWVDNTPPITSKQVGEPQYTVDGKSYVTPQTPIILTAVDQGDCAVGSYQIHYKIDEGEEQIGPLNEPVTVYFSGGGEHTIEYWSVDDLGNEETHHLQTHYIDDVPPKTTKSFEGDVYGDFLTTKTHIILEASDDIGGVHETWFTIKVPCEEQTGECEPEWYGYETGKWYESLGECSKENTEQGCEETYWRFKEELLENGEWMQGKIYSGNDWFLYYGENEDYWLEYFTIPQESTHKICYYSVDKLGNKEEIHCQVHYVDDSPPVTEKQYGEPSYEGNDEWHSTHWITPNTPITLNATDCGDAENCEEHPVGVHEIWFRILEECNPETEECEWELYDPETGEWHEATGEQCTDNPYCYPWQPKYISEYNPDEYGWNLYWRQGSEEGTGPFVIPQESWHKICYYSVDKLGNKEEVQCQDVYVEETPPIIEKEIGEPKVYAKRQLTFSSYYERNPSFFKASNGTWWVFFVKSYKEYGEDGCDEGQNNCDKDSYDVYYMTSDDQGQTWSGPTKVDECSTGQRGMAAFQDDTGKIWVFISAPGDNKIQYCTSDDNGTSWTGPTDTGFTGSHVDAFQASNGTIWAFYEDEDGGTGIEAIKSTDSGNNWTHVTGISPSPNDGIPKAMEANGKLYVVWCNWNEGGKAWYTSSTDGLNGEAWDTPKSLVDVPGTTMCDPVLYQDSTGVFWLFYAPWDNTTNSQWIEYMTSPDGVNWSAPIKLTEGGYNETYWWDMWPEVSEDEHGVIVFYTSEQNHNGTDRINGNIWMIYPNVTYITQNTEIMLSCTDPEPHPCGAHEIWYRVWAFIEECGDLESEDCWQIKYLDGADTDGWILYWSQDNGGTGPFTIPQDSLHVLEYYCVDKLGNKGEVHYQTYLIDSQPPETTKEIGEPSSENGYCITSQTPITLTAEDPEPHPVGVKEIYYRYCLCENYNNGNGCPGEWQTYTEPFTINEESCHKLEWYSVDLLGNEESVQVQEHNVDDTPPTGEITSLEPSYEIDGTTFVKGNVNIHGTVEDNKCFESYTLKACMGEYLTSLKGADRLLETQNNDGTWEWDNPDLDKTNGTGACPSNIVGVTALGLLNAYQLSGKQEYLDAAKVSGDAIVACGWDKGNDKYYSQDIEFLARLGAVTGDSTYTDKAVAIMEYFMTEDNRYCPTDGCTAEELAAFYENYFSDPNDAGYTEWQLASWVRAAQLTGKNSWAEDMKNEILDDISGESPYFDITNTEQNYYVIGLSGVISATGNADALQKLLEFQQDDGSWIDPNGAVQDTAYAVMSLIEVGETEGAKRGAQWLIENQENNGAWIDDGTEYTEVGSEAIQALYGVIKNEIYCTEIASGTQPISNTLGIWHTDMLSGWYDVVLTARDCSGNETQDSMHVYVDNMPPNSWTESPESVTALENQVQVEFTVCWDGSDDGSGIANFDLWVKDGEAPWVAWTPAGADLSKAGCADYLGTIGHRYCFKSRARDNLDNYEEDKDVGDESVSCTDVAAYTFDIHLKQGWNLISVPVVPIDQDIEEVLNDVASDTKVVWAYDPLNPDAQETGGWLVYNPEEPDASNLETMTAGYGYWIEMYNDSTLDVSGTIMPVGGGVAPPQRTLTPGWNLIGHYGVDDKEAACALWPIFNGGRWVQPLWGYEEGSFFQVYGENNMEPGYGYWIAISSNLPENVMYMMSDCPGY